MFDQLSNDNLWDLVSSFRSDGNLICRDDVGAYFLSGLREDQMDRIADLCREMDRIDEVTDALDELYFNGGSTKQMITSRFNDELLSNNHESPVTASPDYSDSFGMLTCANSTR